MTSHLTSQLMGYQMLECIGEGAYGAVYRARQEAVEREVAVKIILPEFANRPEFIRRFESEAQLIAQLEHIHIVPLYDYWRDPDGAYLVMRLMKGGSLEEALIAEETWSPEQAARLVDQIASALEAAHQHGIVHRDLKPANILLDEAGNAYLSDFGIAKELGVGTTSTATGAIMGTPAYLTPEQVQSQPVTPQTDIYALGVLLYELLIGGHPFPDTSTGELVVKHLNEPLPYVRDSRPELPAALDGVIQRATAKNPTDRYHTALSLAEDFRRALQLQAEPTEISEAELYNPYKGLRAFQEIDCDDFFGREALTGQLLAHLAASGESSRFLAVVGPSGSGKSSVVKAGLLPNLRKGALPDSNQWFIVEMHPGSQPLKELQLALLSITADPEVNLGEQLSQDIDGLKRAARSALPGVESELLLVIDQFEELFILVRDEKLRTHFLESLHSAVSDPEGRVRVVITLRADYYDRPLMYPHFGRLVEEHTAVVLPLALEELQQAIQGPADRVGAVLEKGLGAAITSDVVDQPGTLPLLQYALTELFERREGRMLTNQAYQAIGGVLGALGRRAEQVYSALEAGDKEVARQMFLRLVTLGEGAEDTRRRVPRADLESLFGDQGAAINQVIDAFGKARLLSFDRDPTTRGSTVEVAHEALLREWRRLREWLDESRADIRMQVLLSNATKDWLEGNQESSFLLRGSRLAQYEDWVAETTLALTLDERLFLQTSLEDEAQRKAQRAALERRSRNFLRALVAVFAVAAIVAIGLTIFAFNQQGIAQDNAATALAEADARATQQAIAEDEANQRATQQAIAEDEADKRATQQAIAESEAIARAEAEEQALDERNEARRQAGIGLAGMALNELNGRQPERAVPLALEAIENYPYTWQAQRALGMAVLNHRLDLMLQHDGVILFTDLSEDGKRMMTSSGDGTVRIWDTENGEELLLIPELAEPLAIWSPDESRMLIFGGDNDGGWWFQIRDGSSGDLLHFKELDLEWIWWGDFQTPWSPDGERFVTADPDGNVRIWEASSGKELLRLSTQEEEVGATWSPVGDTILTSNIYINELAVRDSASGEIKYTLDMKDFGRPVFGDWSPSGDRFSIREYDWVRIYETASGRILQEINIPGVRISYVRFSPDGNQLITSSAEDGIARLWDAQTGELQGLIGGLTQAQAIAWAPSGELAAVGGEDGRVHVWDTVTGTEKESLPYIVGYIFFIDWSPNGDRLFAASPFASEVWVYKLSQASINLPCKTGFIGIPGWSPDGKQVSTMFSDGIVNVHQVDTQEQVFKLNSGNVYGGASWSPSGNRILTWNQEGPLRIWDSSTGELQLESPDPDTYVFSADWSPDGSQIAGTIWRIEKVAIWDAATLEEMISFDVNAGWATNISWSPDGTRIGTTSAAGEAAIRDAATGEVLLQLFPEDFREFVEGFIWTKDGEQVIVFSNGTGHRFDATTGEELMQYTGHTDAVYKGYWSPDGKLIYTLGGDGTARVFEVETGVELLVYEIGGWLAGILSPDGSQLFITSTEGECAIYPTWQTVEELTTYAKECCLKHELTPDEREQFGLPPSE